MAVIMGLVLPCGGELARLAVTRPRARDKPNPHRPPQTTRSSEQRPAVGSPPSIMAKEFPGQDFTVDAYAPSNPPIRTLARAT